MINSNILKLETLKLFLAVILSFVLIQGCGKKESSTNDEKKSDNKTETSETINLDKPVYVEFDISGDMTGTIKAYYKEKKVKSESNMKVANNEVKATMYSDGTTIYTISEMGGVKTGMKMDATKYYDPAKKDNFDIRSFKDRMKDYTKVGEEDIIGKHCDIYQNNSNQSLKMSVYKDMIPLKIVTGKMTMVATKLETDAKISDNDFTPPGDVKYIDMGNMMEDLKNPDKMKDMQDKMKDMQEQMKNLKK